MYDECMQQNSKTECRRNMVIHKRT